jgi:hypothetical protein
MVRTTIDLEDSVLRDLKRLQKEEKKTLGQLVSELVVAALAGRKKQKGGPVGFAWISRPMGARVDLRDKDALYRALEDDAAGGKP